MLWLSQSLEHEIPHTKCQKVQKNGSGEEGGRNLGETHVALTYFEHFLLSFEFLLLQV